MPEAVTTIHRAAELAAAAEHPEAVARFERRRQLYEAGRALRLAASCPRRGRPASAEQERIEQLRARGYVD